MRELGPGIALELIHSCTCGCSGLLGQTFDGDGLPVHGKRDSYERLDDGTLTRDRKSSGGTVSTHALAEGAIEGTAEMYRVNSPFETNFKFSRFGSRTAVPRNVTALRSHAV